MNSFKSILTMFLFGFLFGILIQPAISAFLYATEYVELSKAPPLSFQVVESTDPKSPPMLGWEPPVTGAVKDNTSTSSGWSLALGKTYVRKESLEETLKINGLEDGRLY